MGLRNSGFTLVEIMAASTLGAFIALVAVGALKAISTSAEIVDNHIEAASEVRFAAKMISRDLINIYRDEDPKKMRLVGAIDDSGQEPISVLTFYTVSRTKARADQPEGDVYEVEYYLLKDQQKASLMRRWWPNPDPNASEPGGILTVIAENIDLFQVRFFDGQEWSEEWPEEMAALPELVEVNIAALPRRQASMAESFIVNFARSTGTVLSITEEAGEQQETGQESTEQGTGTNSGTISISR